MQYACAILLSVACPALPNFFHINLINGTIFGKSYLDMKRVFRVSLQLLSEKIFILRRTERDVIKMHSDLYVNYPLFLPDFNET
jgi:hypothetical protein